MKTLKIIIIVLGLFIAQKNFGQIKLMSYFNEINKDSTINTLSFGKMGYNYQKDLSDEIIIRYFLKNKADLYRTIEIYNPDDNIYSDVKVKRVINALFCKKETHNMLLLCYWFGENAYLSMYDNTKDTLLDSYLFCVLPDEGEIFLHSILFADNYIYTVETRDEETHLRYVKIDFEERKFVIIKDFVTKDYLVIEDLAYKRAKYIKALQEGRFTEEGRLRK